jgi:hypothetical protein
MTNDNNNNSNSESLATMNHATPVEGTTSSSSSIQVNKQQIPSSTPLPTRMVLSAFAGMGAAIFCHPLDVIRVQMQTFHYRNTLHASVSIYKNAGFANGLYAGISAAFLRQC